MTKVILAIVFTVIMVCVSVVGGWGTNIPDRRGWSVCCPGQQSSGLLWSWSSWLHCSCLCGLLWLEAARLEQQFCEFSEWDSLHLVKS
jgi:nitrate reductase gamma subunit